MKDSAEDVWVLPGNEIREVSELAFASSFVCTVMVYRDGLLSSVLFSLRTS